MLKSYFKAVLVGILVISTAFSSNSNIQAKTSNLHPSPYTSTTTKVIDSVVRIDVFKQVEEAYINEKGERVIENTDTLQILGSGVFITEKGTILTCAHLFRNKYTFITVTYLDKKGMFRTVPATVDTVDFKKDLALIHTNTKSLTFPHRKLTKVVQLGQEILVIGHPCALDFTVTRGIISSLSRNLTGAETIQIDAAANPGNSGGPVFDLDGNVVGIVSFLINPGDIKASAGLNFIVSFRECGKFLSKNKALLR